jgi:hypothetical protein
LLPQEVRDDLRARRVDAAEVLALFEWDHIVLHAHDGSDLWWNLDPKLVAAHREKSRKDTAIVAKVKRIEPQWAEFMRKVSLPDMGRSEKPTGRCLLCRFKVRSKNAQYVKARLAQHMREKHLRVRA